MGNDDSDDRIDQLRARVAQLEQQVPDGPTRRQVLAGSGLLGLGGLLGGGATEQVRAQQAAGQVGTESEPVDVFAADVEAQSVNVESGKITGPEITINIPSDYSTLPDAIDAASQELTPKNDTGVIVNIESGHSISNGVVVRDGDYSNISIQSDDATVAVDASINQALFAAYNAEMPVLDCKIDLQSNGTSGISALENSSVFVTENSGIINSGGRGLYISASTGRALNTDWSGASGEPLRVSNNGMATVQSSDFTGGGDRLFVSRSSLVNAASITTDTQLACRRSRLNAQDSTIGGSILCDEGGVISALGATVDNGVNCRYGSQMALRGATINSVSSQDPVALDSQSQIDLENSEIIGTDRYGVFIETGSKINLKDAQFASYSGDFVIATSGGGAIVNADGVTVNSSAITSDDINLSDFNTIETDGLVFG